MVIIPFTVKKSYIHIDYDDITHTHTDYLESLNALMVNLPKDDISKNILNKILDNENIVLYRYDSWTKMNNLSFYTGEKTILINDIRNDADYDKILNILNRQTNLRNLKFCFEKQMMDFNATYPYDNFIKIINNLPLHIEKIYIIVEQLEFSIMQNIYNLSIGLKKIIIWYVYDITDLYGNKDTNMFYLNIPYILSLKIPFGCSIDVNFYNISTSTVKLYNDFTNITNIEKIEKLIDDLRT